MEKILGQRCSESGYALVAASWKASHKMVITLIGCCRTKEYPSSKGFAQSGTGAWRDAQSMRDPRDHRGAVLLRDGRVMDCGGSMLFVTRNSTEISSL